MCLLCQDEKAYLAYMTYLDEIERQGRAADPEAAMQAARDISRREAIDAARARNDNPFQCNPVDE
jgi:hypothetical protein